MKSVFAMVLFVALLFTGCEATASSSEEASAAPQSTTTLLGRVSSVSGNDIVLTLGSYTGSVKDSGAGESTGSGETAGERRGSGDGEAPTGAPPSGEAPSGEAPAGEMPAGEMPGNGESAAGPVSGGQGGNVSFRESGETRALRIPVGTPIVYGSLKVDFSQLQPDYIISLTLGGQDGQTVVAGEILST